MRVKADVRVLQQIPLFADSDTGHLQLLSFASKRVELEKGSILFQKGTTGAAAYLVLEGTAEVYDTTEASGDVVATAESGALLGELSMIANVAYGVTVKTASSFRRAEDRSRAVSAGCRGVSRVRRRVFLRKLACAAGTFGPSHSDGQTAVPVLVSADRCDHRNVVGGPPPASNFGNDIQSAASPVELRIKPDMIQSPPAVRGAPVAGPIAPPGVELFFQGYARAHGIDQAATRRNALSLSVSTGV